MRKKVIFIIGAAVLILGVLGVALLNREKEPLVAGLNSEGTTILYSTKTCPHCRNVKDWLVKNGAVRERSGLIEKDANSPGVVKEMKEKMKECDFDSSGGILVPLLFDQGKCFLGDQPIIDYLSQEYH